MDTRGSSLGRMFCAAWLAASAGAWGHSYENYAGHDAGLCKPADPRSTGALSCSDPLANPCYSGQHCELNGDGNRVCHGHGAWPAGKNQTPACEAYMDSLRDPDPPDPPDPPETPECVCCDGTQLGTGTDPAICPDLCAEWVARLSTVPAACEAPTCHAEQAHCDAYGHHVTHDCAVCDDQNGTCGWTNRHRHPGECPPVNPPPPPERPPVNPPPPPEELPTCDQPVFIIIPLGD